MRVPTRAEAVGTGGCIALAATPSLLHLSHAGYYVGVAAILAGALLGFRAVVLMFLVGVIVAAMFVREQSSGPGDPQPGLALVFAPVIAVLYALPALLGATMGTVLRRWGQRARRRGAPPAA